MNVSNNLTAMVSYIGSTESYLEVKQITITGVLLS